MRARLSLPLLSLPLAGCADMQSALSPQGPQAERLAALFWAMTSASAAILVIVVVFIGLALFGPARLRETLSADAMVVAGGVIFPVVTLSALLIANFALFGRGAEARMGEEPIRVSVVGERWWWRVAYRLPDGGGFETANEVRVPVGRTIELTLTSADVIHSFWAPRLAGKLDMFPGRQTTLRFAADRAGVSRGQCAEYCGGAHAMMAFNVVAMAPADYAQWLRGQAAPAPAGDARARAGRDMFLSSGCGACHTIRGATAAAALGPDLTHVGGRLSIGAGVLPADRASIAAWIVDNQHIKPGNQMPAFDTLGADRVAAISAYLAGLR
jgi:cytochrome c oxidase subunit 2